MAENDHTVYYGEAVGAIQVSVCLCVAAQICSGSHFREGSQRKARPLCAETELIIEWVATVHLGYNVKDG